MKRNLDAFNIRGWPERGEESRVTGKPRLLNPGEVNTGYFIELIRDILERSIRAVNTAVSSAPTSLRHTSLTKRDSRTVLRPAVSSNWFSVFTQSRRVRQPILGTVAWKHQAQGFSGSTHGSNQGIGVLSTGSNHS